MLYLRKIEFICKVKETIVVVSSMREDSSSYGFAEMIIIDFCE